MDTILMKIRIHEKADEEMVLKYLESNVMIIMLTQVMVEAQFVK